MLILPTASVIDERQGWKETLGLNSWEETDGERSSTWLTAISTNKGYMLLVLSCWCCGQSRFKYLGMRQMGWNWLPEAWREDNVLPNAYVKSYANTDNKNRYLHL